MTSRLVWNNPAPWFGGFSGAEVSPAGDELTLITDKGSLVTARVIRAGDSSIRDVQITNRVQLRAANGRTLKGKRSDAEGLAIGADGAAYVSFEHRPRVARLDLRSAKTSPFQNHPDFTGFEANKGMEALAIHPDGTLYTLPEQPPVQQSSFPLYARDAKGWRVTHKIPQRGPFMIVGADFDAQGRLYLLERAISPVGFRSRIRRFNLNPSALREETIFTSGPGKFDNLEAISIWGAEDGGLRIILLSDDNFLTLQRTEIIELTLRE